MMTEDAFRMKVRAAATKLFERRCEFDEMAGQAGQVSQDSEVEKLTWIDLAAQTIEECF